MDSKGFISVRLEPRQLVKQASEFHTSAHPANNLYSSLDFHTSAHLI